MQLVEPNGIYDQHEVSDLLKVSPNTLRKMMIAGLRHKKTGGIIRFRGLNILEFLDGNGEHDKTDYNIQYEKFKKKHVIKK